MSSIEERKNLLTLLKVLKIFQKNLVIIGDGLSYKKKCLDFIHHNKLEKELKYFLV